jgi:hypothetical protein
MDSCNATESRPLQAVCHSLGFQICDLRDQSDCLTNDANALSSFIMFFASTITTLFLIFRTKIIQLQFK